MTAGVTAVSIHISCLCVGGDCKYTVGEVSNSHARCLHINDYLLSLLGGGPWVSGREMFAEV